MHVDDFMNTGVITVGADETLAAAQALLSEHGISCLPVLDGTKAVGVVSRTDLLRIGRRQAGARPGAALLALPDQQVRAIMTPRIVTVGPSTTVSDAAANMVEHRVHRVFVLKDDELVGVFSTREAMRALAQRRGDQRISAFMSSPIFSVRAEEPVSLATERLEKAHVSGLVVTEQDWPIGVFTQVEALASKDAPRGTAVEEVMSPSMLCLVEDAKLHRAAAQAANTRVRRVIAVQERHAKGILTGLDFARALAG